MSKGGAGRAWIDSSGVPHNTASFTKKRDKNRAKKKAAKKQRQKGRHK